jgi:hypothetical protein
MGGHGIVRGLLALISRLFVHSRRNVTTDERGILPGSYYMYGKPLSYGYLMRLSAPKNVMFVV